MERSKVQERGTSLTPSKREGLVLVETCNDIHWRGHLHSLGSLHELII